MITLNPQVRRAVYDKIVSMGNFYGKYADGTYNNDDLNVVNFLKQIWDLPAMRSEDPRFRNAEADATQHLINNDDWDTSYVFERRFNLLAGEQVYFVKFVELVVSPMVRVDRTEMEEYVNAINECLKPANCELTVEDFLDGEPVYRLKEGLDHSEFPIDINKNTLQVYVSSSPDTYPSLDLHEYRWDDFGFKTRYKLYYCESSEIMHLIGVVKIMKKGEGITYGQLPDNFCSLSDEYCSLGQDMSYYRNIKKYLGSKYKDVLFAMRDAACFSKIADNFIEESVFKVYVDFEVSGNNIKAAYRLENQGNKINVEMFSLIERHFSKFDLLNRFNLKAIQEISELRNLYVVEDFSNEAEYNAFVAKQIRKIKMDMPQLGYNHWKVILYLSAATSDVFKKYILSLSS